MASKLDGLLFGSLLHSPSDDTNGDSKNERQPLLEGTPGDATVWSSIYNLVNTTVGVGVLALPYAARRAGLALGLIFLLVFGSLAGFSHMLLTWSSHKAKRATYREIATHAFGDNMGTILDCLIVGQTIGGGLTAFPIIIGSTVTDLSEDWVCDDCILTERIFVIYAVMWLIIFPMCLFPKLDFLKYTSALAIVCATCIPIVLGYNYSEGTDESSEYDVVYFNLDWDIFLAMPLITASFSAHFNSVRIFKELKDSRPEVMSKIVRWSIFFTLVIYCSSATLGYLSFRDDTESDVLENLDSGKVYVAITKIAIILLLVFSYPVIQFACRSSLSNLIFKQNVATLGKRAFLSALIVAVTSTLAYLVPDIAVVFSFSASTAAVCVIWLIPAASYIKIHPEPAYSTQRIFAKIQFCLGVVFGCLGLYVAFDNVL
eukprot:TRINITY_DN9501_c0_g1_i1.p1 TRINITY_DN9501_c0_g1~~TRINITY_DN9501_c0_g1_i1.p1  ORF type:complete len:430 (-),score=78.58 TRINITY_DN9501_c0_g1_i1:242-1531(-)